MFQVLKSPYGSVRPYSRHRKSCEHSEQPEYGKCSCPKWIYRYCKGGARRRYSLNTPSFSKALNIAVDTLQGFDLKIAEVREQKSKKASECQMVGEARALWLERTRNLLGDEADIVNQYRSTFGWRDREAKPHGNLLLYVEQDYEANPTKQIKHVQEVTPLFCQQWHDRQYQRILPGPYALTLDREGSPYCFFFRSIHSPAR